MLADVALMLNKIAAQPGRKGSAAMQGGEYLSDEAWTGQCLIRW